MPSVQAIRTLRIQYESTGADRVRADADAVVASQDRVAQATTRTATITETASKRQLSRVTDFDRLRQSYDGLYRAQVTMESGLSRATRAFQTGVADLALYERTVVQIRQRYDDVVAAAHRAAAAHGTVSAANQNNRLQPYQLSNLRSQAFDIFTSLQGGISPFTVASQQGPQVYEALAGQTGLAGGLKAAGASLASFLTPMRVAIGGVGALAVAGVSAYASFTSSQHELQVALGGSARAAGNSREAINALAPAAATAGGVSVREARSMAAQFAATGQISDGIFGRMIAITKDFAATTGTDIPDATTTLAQALADPLKGFDTLAKKVGGADASQRANIRTLIETGDRYGAQKALLDAFQPSLAKAAESVGLLAKAWQAVTTGASNAYDAAGQAIARQIEGPSLSERARESRRAFEAAQRNGNANPASASELEEYMRGGLTREQAMSRASPSAPGSSFTAGAAERARQNYIATNSRKRGEEEAQALGADAYARAQQSLARDTLVRGANPIAEQIEKLENSAKQIKRDFIDTRLDGDGSAERVMNSLATQAKRMREDLAAGGSGLADALRGAQFSSRTSGFTASAQAEAAAREAADLKRRAIDLDDKSDVNAKDAARRTLDETVRVEVDRIRSEARRSELQVGGAFSRMSPEVQRQLQEGATRFGRVPVGILAAIAEHESNGNLDVGFTKSLDENGKRGTAYGLGQITQSTGEALRTRLPGFDRTNRDTMGLGLAGVLDMKLDAAGGDLTRALMGYRGSRDPDVNRAYAADIMRRAGQMGDASALGQVRDLDANRQALETANTNLRLNTDLYGRNGQALEAQTRLEEMLREARARGIPVDAELRSSYERTAEAMASASRKLTDSKAGRDLQFDADQLGRTRIDQAAFARARSLYGDTNSNEARAYIDQARTIGQLTEAKQTFSDVFGGVVSDLRRGSDAASIASNAFGRFADKLISNSIDKLASGLFGGAGGIETGIFGSIGKLLGFADGGYLHGSGGPRSDNLVIRASPGEYVVNAMATAMHRPLLDHINGGGSMRLPGYADGGFLPAPTGEFGEAAGFGELLA